MRVLHIAPHPDDELLGAPATLFALMDAGHEVENLAVSLGRKPDRVRRERELRDACERAGFGLTVASPPYEIELDDDRAAAQARLTQELVSRGLEGRFGLLVGPSPHDGHHGHEVVGRAAVAAATALLVPLWMWGLWSDLPVPTLLCRFEQPVLERVVLALSAHVSQIERMDIRVLARARAEVAAVTGAELVFGFGGQGIDAAYAELLCEVVPSSGQMLLGAPRILDPHAPLAEASTVSLTPWLRESSLRDRLGRRH